MKGQRTHGECLEPGDYAYLYCRWYAKTPSGLVANLGNHKVTEHEDGTITVTPSILVRGTVDETPNEITWHGFLERGVWREC